MNDVTQPARGRGLMLSVVAMLAALVALLATAPFASATSDPVASGTTSITLNKGFSKKLKKYGIKVLKVSPGKVKGRVVSLPVSGGSMDPVNGLGNLELSGGLKFKLGKKTAPLNTLLLDTAQSSLTGKVAGKSMKIAGVSGLTYSRNGFGVNVNVAKLKLTGKAAKQLNKKLGFTGQKKGKGKAKGHKRAAASKAVQPPFKGNQVLGGTLSETQPKTVAVLPTGKANLNTDEATVKKLVQKVLPSGEGFGVKIVPIPPTEAEAVANPFTPILKFPLSGGTIGPTASSGIVQTTGGVKLVQTPEEEVGPLIKGTTTLTLGNIWVDLGAKTATAEVVIESTISPELNKGGLGRASIADLNLTGATIKSDPTGRTVTVENAVATLQEITAETLTSVFGAPYDAAKLAHPKFAKGDGLGTFSFTAQTQ